MEVTAAQRLGRNFKRSEPGGPSFGVGFPLGQKYF